MKKAILLFICLFILAGCEKPSAAIDDYNMAQQALEQKDWPLASRLGQRILLEEVDQQRRWNAWQVVILANKNMGDTTWVLSSLESMLAEFDEPEYKPLIYKELIEAYAATYQYEKGIEVCMLLMESENLTPLERAELELIVARFSVNMNDFFVAEDMLLACLDREGAASIHNDCMYLLANVYYLSDKQTEAFETINQYLTFDNIPNEQKALLHFIKGDIFEVQGDTEKALKEFYTALEFHPNPGVVEVRIKNLQKPSTS